MEINNGDCALCQSIYTKHNINVNIVKCLTIFCICIDIFLFSLPCCYKTDRISTFFLLAAFKKIKTKLATANSLWGCFRFPDSEWGHDIADYQAEVWKKHFVTMQWKVIIWLRIPSVFKGLDLFKKPYVSIPSGWFILF